MPITNLKVTQLRALGEFDSTIFSTFQMELMSDKSNKQVAVFFWLPTSYKTAVTHHENIYPTLNLFQQSENSFQSIKIYVKIATVCILLSFSKISFHHKELLHVCHNALVTTLTKHNRSTTVFSLILSTAFNRNF